jgi:NADH:ubiquinone oxidoreductase subunit K
MKNPGLNVTRTILLILISTALTLGAINVAFSQGSSSTTVEIVPSTTSAHVGDTITVNITVSNVQNLYALDVTLNWNTSVLQFLNAGPRLGVESYPDGVLYGNIYVVENNASQDLGEYDLVATSQGQVPWFNGTGNIAMITFQVTGVGQSVLYLTTELSDGNPSGANFIAHSDVNGTVNSSVIPEFPSLFAIALLLVFATIAVVVLKKTLNKNSPRIMS